MKAMHKNILGLLLASLVVGSTVLAQTTGDLAKGVAQWKAMLAEGNPAELYELDGEDLWNQPRGPKKAVLAGACDLGQGKGVIKGVFVTLPRYFEDTGRVQDLESRLMTCMQEIQGIDVDKEIVNGAFRKGERGNVAALATYVAAASKGMPVNVPQNHAQEKQFYEMGRQMFFFRSGPMDFSCATCHGAEGKRIRASALPNLASNNQQAGEAFSAWPAYRVSNAQLWTMQHRLNDCFRQQRFPEPIYGSDITIALGVFMGVEGKGVPSVAPGIKR